MQLQTQGKKNNISKCFYNKTDYRRYELQELILHTLVFHTSETETEFCKCFYSPRTLILGIF